MYKRGGLLETPRARTRAVYEIHARVLCSSARPRCSASAPIGTSRAPASVPRASARQALTAHPKPVSTCGARFPRLVALRPTGAAAFQPPSRAHTFDCETSQALTGSGPVGVENPHFQPVRSSGACDGQQLFAALHAGCLPINSARGAGAVFAGTFSSQPHPMGGSVNETAKATK